MMLDGLVKTLVQENSRLEKDPEKIRKEEVFELASQISDEDLEKLNTERPYTVKAVVPDDVYPGVPGFQTFGTPLGANILASVPQELQYKVVKAMLDHWDEYLTIIPRYEIFESPFKFTLEFPVMPLAAGTVQYLKEEGYTVPEELIPPEYVE